MRLELSDLGATAGAGVNLTDAEVLAKTEVGPSGFTDTGLTSLFDMCHDYSGNLYILDRSRNCVVKVSEGGEVRWVAGSRAGVGGNNATLQNVALGDARFNAPEGICCDKTGTVYIADTGNNQIRTIKNNKVGVLAGKLASGFVDGDGISESTSVTARFNGPADVCVDKSGVVYVADRGNHAVRKVMNNGKVVTLAGNGVAGDKLAENYQGSLTAITETATTWPSRKAMFSSPDNVVVDLQGNVYVWDVGNIKLKKITPDGQVHLHSGIGTAGTSLGTGTNPAFTCQYTYLYGMDVDESGNIYAADYRTSDGLSRIVKIDFNGKPSVIAAFSNNTYAKGPWSISCTPGQSIFVGLTY
jgi:sugar lactone lactonase YvrE